MLQARRTTRVSIIVNPASDNGSTATFWPRAVRRIRRAGLDFQAVFTEYPGQATPLAIAAAEAGAEIIAYVGGDGTANEVANGILSLPPQERPALAALPRGTGADLPRSLQIERGLDAALSRMLDPRIRRMDTAESYLNDADGALTHRHFVNMADVGLGGYVASRVDGRTKAFGGFASFLSSIVHSFWLYENPVVRVVVDGRTVHEGHAASVVVANGSHFGGGIKMAPAASPWDGFLDVVVLGDIDRRDLLLNLERLYRGRHLTHPKVRAHRGREVLIDGEDGLPLEMDGESPGSAPFHVRVAPRSLPVLV